MNLVFYCLLIASRLLFLKFRNLEAVSWMILPYPTLLRKIGTPSWYPVSPCGQLFPAKWSQIRTKMAASILDGEKICEVAGSVRWSSMENVNLEYHSGSLALYKLSSSYYIHGITAFKRVKVNIELFYCMWNWWESVLCQAYCLYT